MKNLLNLGTVLNNVEQKSINGGGFKKCPPTIYFGECYSNSDCDSGGTCNRCSGTCSY